LSPRKRTNRTEGRIRDPSGGSRTFVFLSAEELLQDAEAAAEGELTYAALILFGTPKAVGRHLAPAEVVFEYRSSEAAEPAQDRIAFRRGVFAFHDELWNRINLRNDKQDFQDGLFVHPIPTFTEQAVREAILNAVSHRDYQLGGSTFVRPVARSPATHRRDVGQRRERDEHGPQVPRQRRTDQPVAQGVRAVLGGVPWRAGRCVAAVPETRKARRSAAIVGLSASAWLHELVVPVRAGCCWRLVRAGSFGGLNGTRIFLAIREMAGGFAPQHPQVIQQFGVRLHLLLEFRQPC
jgi:hypothetical protein